MIKYIFCGNMFADIENDIKKMKTPPPVSSHKFQDNMVKGLIENSEDVTVFNIPRIRYFPHYPKIMVKQSFFDSIPGVKANSVNIRFINLPFLNYFTHRRNLVKEIRKIVRKNQKDTYVLISFNTYLPQNKAMIQLRKSESNVRICTVIGDLHGANGVRAEGRYDGIKGKITEYIEMKQDELLREYDYFGFLTKYMADAVGVQDKPWTVIEGMYSEQKTSDDGVSEAYKTKKSKRTIFYAGAIEREYGLEHLLNSFSLIADPNYSLEIAGGGKYVSEIQERAETDTRIKYLGFLTPKEVKFHQDTATVLVNPRQSTHEFIKYSFPSKNMECLASGKPYVAHKLVCNPREYDEYIQYPVDETDEAFAQKIVEVSSLSDEARNQIGENGRQFILNDKNPKKQMSKLLVLIKSNLSRF